MYIRISAIFKQVSHITEGHFVKNLLKHEAHKRYWYTPGVLCWHMKRKYFYLIWCRNNKPRNQQISTVRKLMKISMEYVNYVQIFTEFIKNGFVEIEIESRFNIFMN